MICSSRRREGGFRWPIMVACNQDWPSASNVHRAIVPSFDGTEAGSAMDGDCTARNVAGPQRRRGRALGGLALGLVTLVACSPTGGAAVTRPEPATSSPGTVSAMTSTGSISALPQSATSSANSSTGVPPSTTAAEAPSFVGLHMVDADTGWAIADMGLLHTRDGGRSWTLRNPGGVDPAGLQPSPETHAWGNAAFTGSSEAWVAAAGPDTVTVFHTADAGQSWSAATVKPESDAKMDQSDTPAVIGLDFPTPTDGWLLTTAGGIAAGVQDIELYRTVDAGATWKLLAAATQQRPSPSGLPAEGVKTGIGFTGPDHGWITGYRGSQPGMWLYETADGGKTWHTSALPTPAGISTAASPQSFPPHFTKVGHGVIPVTWPGATSTTVFYVTNDDGATWQATTPIESADPMQLWTWPTGRDAAAASDTTWCVTDNASATWHCEPLPAALHGISDLSFASPQAGWAIADGSLLTTTDNGRSWEPVVTRLTQ